MAVVGRRLGQRRTGARFEVERQGVFFNDNAGWMRMKRPMDVGNNVAGKRAAARRGAPEIALRAQPNPGRRRLIKMVSGASLMAMVAPGVRHTAWAAGSDAPEKKEVKVGFIPLTDCASVVIASVMKFDEKYGIKIVLSKEASWAAVRDKLVNGELDAAHVLYGLVYGVQLGIGGPKKDMAVLCTLNNNGQAITLSNQLKDKGATDGPLLKTLFAR